MLSDRELSRITELVETAGRYAAENVEWGYLPVPCDACGRTDEDAEACDACVDGLDDPELARDTVWYTRIVVRNGWGTAYAEHRGNVVRPLRDAVDEARRYALAGIADVLEAQANDARRRKHRHYVRILTSKPLPPELERVDWDGIETARGGTGYLLAPDRARAVAVRLRGQTQAPGRDTDATRETDDDPAP